MTSKLQKKKMENNVKDVLSLCEEDYTVIKEKSKNFRVLEDLFFTKNEIDLSELFKFNLEMIEKFFPFYEQQLSESGYVIKVYPIKNFLDMSYLFAIKKIELHLKEGIHFFIQTFNIELIRMLESTYKIGQNEYFVKGKTEGECIIKALTLLKINLEMDTESTLDRLINSCKYLVSWYNNNCFESMKNNDKKTLIQIREKIQNYLLLPKNLRLPKEPKNIKTENKKFSFGSAYLKHRKENDTIDIYFMYLVSQNLEKEKKMYAI